jgi:hypothetical protein
MYKEIKLGEVVVQVIDLETNQVTSINNTKYLAWKEGSAEPKQTPKAKKTSKKTPEAN